MQSNKRQHNKRNLLIIMIMLQMKKKVAKQFSYRYKTKTLDNINSLSSNNDVENAKVAGINEIANVLPATAVKSKAKKILIKNSRNRLIKFKRIKLLQLRKKEAAIQLANQKSNEARTAIQNEHSNNGVAQAKSNGIHEIELVMPDAHKNLMLNKVSIINIMSKSNTINTTPDATDEESKKH